MDDVYLYQIRIRGQVEEEEINTMSPLQTTAVQVEDNNTVLTVCTDQSGLVGLIRHLHSLGLVLLSVNSTNRYHQEPVK